MKVKHKRYGGARYDYIITVLKMKQFVVFSWTHDSNALSITNKQQLHIDLITSNTPITKLTTQILSVKMSSAEIASVITIPELPAFIYETETCSKMLTFLQMNNLPSCRSTSQITEMSNQIPIHICREVHSLSSTNQL